KTSLAKQGTSNPTAYSLYVKGRYSFDRFDPQYTKNALADFQQAVEEDPVYAQAYGGMGDAYAMLTFFKGIDLEEGVQKAKAAAHRALELDPSVAEGYCALGVAAYVHYDFEEAEREARRCVELNPNLSYAHQLHAWTMHSLGKSEQALAEQKLAVE